MSDWGWHEAALVLIVVLLFYIGWVLFRWWQHADPKEESSRDQTTTEYVRQASLAMEYASVASMDGPLKKSSATINTVSRNHEHSDKEAYVSKHTSTSEPRLNETTSIKSPEPVLGSPLINDDIETLFRDLGQLRKEVGALRAEVMALKEQAVQRDDHRSLEQEDDSAYFYREAMIMAGQGCHADDIASSCSISRAEADLVLALQGQRA